MALRRAPVQITLVDRRNFHLFQPLTYQVATGGLSAAQVAYPLRAIFKRDRNVRVLMAEAADFDLDARELRLRPVDGTPAPDTIPYDSLIVAGGSHYSYFGHDEWADFAHEVKSLESALAVRSQVLSAFEAADAEAAGYELSEWVELVTAQAIANELDPPWAISCDWQMARSIYEVYLPEDGWWVRVDHSDTLNALVDQYPHRDLRTNPLLTLADLEGEDRTLTTVLAEHIRNLLLDDGSEALGINFPSKTGYGRC